MDWTRINYFFLNNENREFANFVSGDRDEALRLALVARASHGGLGRGPLAKINRC